MSEYQYYEFQAIDRPLSDADRRALRDLSSRAPITVTSFTNSCEWGDFRGDPAKLMERWFDLHLYLANWGSRRLMIRLPMTRDAAATPVVARTVGGLRARAKAIGVARMQEAASKSAGEQKRRAAEADNAQGSAFSNRATGRRRLARSRDRNRRAQRHRLQQSGWSPPRASGGRQGTRHGRGFPPQTRAIREEHARKERFIERLTVLG